MEKFSTNTFNKIVWLVSNMYFRNYIAILICILGSCTLLKDSKLLEISTQTDLLKKIPLKQQKFSLELKEDSLVVYFPKSTVLKLFDMYLDTFQLNIDSGVMPIRNNMMLKKYSSMKRLLLEHEYYEIVSISQIDSLNKYDLYEMSLLMEENAEIGFRLYFNDIFCQMLEKGDLAIKEKGRFIDTVYMYQYSESDGLSGSTYVEFITKNGLRICNCPPYFHYN